MTKLVHMRTLVPYLQPTRARIYKQDFPLLGLFTVALDSPFSRLNLTNISVLSTTRYHSGPERASSPTAPGQDVIKNVPQSGMLQHDAV